MEIMKLFHKFFEPIVVCTTHCTAHYILQYVLSNNVHSTIEMIIIDLIDSRLFTASVRGGGTVLAP